MLYTNGTATICVTLITNVYIEAHLLWVIITFVSDLSV